MKKILIAISLCCVTPIVYAQEVNIGVHANPIFSTPVMTQRSVLQQDVAPYWLRLGYNVGVNVNVKLGKAGVELGANYLSKNMTFTSREQQLGFDTYYRVVFPSTAIELPVMVNLLLHHHDKDNAYDVYLTGGAAYEIGSLDNNKRSASSEGTGVKMFVEGRYTGAVSYSTITPIIGFKINAILRHVGLIDYGLTFHYPLGAPGPFVVSSGYSLTGGSAVYTNNIYAHNSYIDVKFAYYFLSLGKGMKRVKYLNY